MMMTTNFITAPGVCSPFTNSGDIYVSHCESNVWVVEEVDAVLADTMWVEDITVFPGETVRVDVFARNSLYTKGFTVTIGWGGSFQMTYDSVSTVGTRTEGFEEVNRYAFDPIGHKAAFRLTSALGDYPPQIPPGEGVILSVYFSILTTASGEQILFDLLPYSTKLPVFSNECIDIAPTVRNGYITLASCCSVTRGDVNGDGTNLDIVDLTCIVDFLFGSGCEQPCASSADVNADGSQADIVDLTFLVDYLFGYPPTPKTCVL